MELRLEFTDIDGTPGSEFSPAVTDGQYALPRLVLTADGPFWAEDADITSCEVLTGDEQTGDALRTAWRRCGPSGHGTELSSAQCWLPAARITERTEIRVTWLVTWYDTGPYERLLTNVDPFEKVATVTLSFEPASAAPGEPHMPSSPRHRGHVAVDFGTSNCTATLFDQQYLPPARPLSPRQVGKLRADVLDLLQHLPSAGDDVQAEFGEFVADIAAAILPEADGDSDDELRTSLRRALAEDGDREPRLLYALLLELERCIGQCSEELRPPLAAALNDAYKQSWRIPPLDQLRLFEVLLDVNEEYVLESKATATLSPQLKVRVGRLALDEDDGQEALVYAGLKQRLAAADPHPELGPDATSDDLIRESLRDLIGRCDSFIREAPREIGKGTINNVVVTFPTMATPVVRGKLRTMVESIGVGLVDNSFDEAVAAAMFVLLCDFGGDYDTGLELLRSRSRPVGPGQWKQNLLIIDIGGGTTDIALLGLHLRDETPAGLGDPGKHGRYYVLRPEILGSTGRLQLGGELLSLRVFYWIKALLGDQLLKLFPGSYEQAIAALRQITRDNLGENPFRNLARGDSSVIGGEDKVLNVLDGVVPTRSPAGYGRPGQAFWLLWSTADDVKLRFCANDAPEEITLRAAEIRRLLRAAEWPAELTSIPDIQSVSDDDLAITLTKAGFEKLVTSDIDQIMELAYQLAGERLAGLAGERPPGTEERLDRVMLTGQASKAPLVRKQLMKVFSDAAHDGLAVPWQPSAVGSVQSEFAKLATSLGASWAKSSQELVPMPEGAIRGLLRGRNAFRIVVDNLFFNLPCTFLISQELTGQHNALEILHIGGEMYQAYPDQDIAVIRSEPIQLTPTVAIFRDSQGDKPRWGDFQWKVMAKDLGLTLDPGIWQHNIKARLEATSSLDLFLLLYQETAHYQVGGPSVSVLPAVAAAVGGTAHDIDPGRIVVNAFWGDATHEGTPVFPPRSAPGDADFPEMFHVQTPGRPETEVFGAVSDALPVPPGGGTWHFHYLDDQNGMHEIGVLRPPPRTGQLNIRYYASVDKNGDLRVHAGEVPYWPAYSLAEVEERPGSVFRTPMESTYTDYDPSRDPYNGQH